MKLQPFFQFIPRNHTPRSVAQCSACRRLLPVSDFYERHDRPVWVRSHWSSQCRECIKLAALKKYQANPAKGAARRTASRQRRAAKNAWMAHMAPEFRHGIAEAAQARRKATLEKSFNHSLWLHANPYPPGYPHSYSAKAHLEKIKRAAQVGPAVPSVTSQPLAKWAAPGIDPADALEMLRAMHQQQRE